MTPRKFYSLLTVHYDLMALKNGHSSEQDWRTKKNGNEAYIDQIPGF